MLATLRNFSAPVAQLDRVLPSEGRGRTFESSRARQFKIKSRPTGWFLFFGSAPVAQLDRVLGYEPRGRAFESLRARHELNGLGDHHLAHFYFAQTRDGAGRFVLANAQSGTVRRHLASGLPGDRVEWRCRPPFPWSGCCRRSSARWFRRVQQCPGWRRLAL